MKSGRIFITLLAGYFGILPGTHTMDTPAYRAAKKVAAAKVKV